MKRGGTLKPEKDNGNASTADLFMWLSSSFGLSLRMPAGTR